MRAAPYGLYLPEESLKLAITAVRSLSLASLPEGAYLLFYRQKCLICYTFLFKCNIFNTLFHFIIL